MTDITARQGNGLPVEPKQPVPNTEEKWTVRRVLHWTTEHLQKHGSETPRLDAEILLAFTRGCDRIHLYTRFDDELTDVERAKMRDLVKRRAAREPVAYLVGHREFYGVDFLVSADVLIPRPETETLVLETLELAKTLSQPRILDLGTGSGCIAVSLALNQPTAAITAVDISAEALEIAQRNAQRHHVNGRIEFLLGDLFAPLAADAKYDLIVSNPPYVRRGEIPTLQPEVRLHEPSGALDGGVDGLDVIRLLIDGAADRLTAGGALLFEFSPEQATPIREMLEADAHWTAVRIIKDLSRLDRIALARKAA